MPDRSDNPKPSRPTRAAHDPVPSGVEIAPGVRVPDAALRFIFTTSTGPGGQNVNKRATRAVLRLTIADIPLRDSARSRLLRLGSHYVTDAGELIIESGEHRSQPRNRAECLAKLRALLIRAIPEPKVRKPTRPTRGSIERRIAEKKRRGDIKKRRSNDMD